MRYPTPKWPPDKLLEVVAKYNTMVDALNLMVPRIADAIEGTRVTKNMVGKTTRDNIQDIICRFAPEGLHVYLDTSYIYSVYLVARFSVPVGGPFAGVEYFEQSIQIATREHNTVNWVGAELDNPLPWLQLTEVQEQLADVNAAAIRRQEAEEQLHRAIHKCRQFLRDI